MALIQLRQITPEIFDIGDVKYYITPFPAFTAANISGELASVLTPILSALIPLADGLDTNSERKLGLGDIDVSKAANVISNCSEIDGNKIERLMEKLLISGNVVAEFEDEDSGKIKQEKLSKDLANELFCGNVQDMYILCFQVIKINFNGFFKRFAALSGKTGTANKTKRKIL